MRLKLFWFCMFLFILGCVKNEIDGVADLITNDWILERTENNLRIFSNNQCIREVMRKSYPDKINETINPTIKIAFEQKWSSQDYEEANVQFNQCEREIIEHPERAMACIKKIPDLDTKSYSVFISSKDCNSETVKLLDEIKNYLNKFT